MLVKIGLIFLFTQFVLQMHFQIESLLLFYLMTINQMYETHLHELCTLQST